MDAQVLTTWVLSAIFALLTLVFILRIVLTWYPQANLNKLPFNLVAWPTEPFLIPLRKVVPSFGGIDITPIIWVGIITLMREILLGQQGILTMMMQG